MEMVYVSPRPKTDERMPINNLGRVVSRLRQEDRLSGPRWSRERKARVAQVLHEECVPLVDGSMEKTIMRLDDEIAHRTSDRWRYMNGPITCLVWNADEDLETEAEMYGRLLMFAKPRLP